MLAEGFRPKRALDPDAKYGPYWRRQYIFAAATMPTITYSDVGSQIQKMYPQATWVSTELLHIAKPHVTHAWHEVGRKPVCSSLSVLRDLPGQPVMWECARGLGRAGTCEQQHKTARRITKRYAGR